LFVGFPAELGLLSDSLIRVAVREAVVSVMSVLEDPDPVSDLSELPVSLLPKGSVFTIPVPELCTISEPDLAGLT